MNTSLCWTICSEKMSAPYFVEVNKGVDKKQAEEAIQKAFKTKIGITRACEAGIHRGSAEKREEIDEDL